MLTPTVSTPAALLRKAEREQYRAYHHPSPTHKADHLLNFCITVHSLRDHYCEHAGILTSEARTSLECTWRAQPLLVAVAEIANTAKHFQLRQRRGKRAPLTARTKRVRRGRTRGADVYIDRDGHLHLLGTTAPDWKVTLSDGRSLSLFTFTDGVLAYWRTFFRSNGLTIRRQAWSSLSGT